MLKIWLATIFAGGMLGIGAGALRELFDRGFRTSDQVKSVLNTECLSMIPRLGHAQSRVRQLSFKQGEVLHPARMLWAAVEAPNSLFADAMRAIKLSIDSGEPGAGNVVGLTSYLPTEGKSTVAAGIASLMAQGGRRTILVDCDVRNPSLSRSLAPDAKVGFLEVVGGEVDVSQAVLRDPATKLAFLPMVKNEGWGNPTEMLASSEARRLIESLKTVFDCVIIDMAPLISTVDIRAASRIIDSYLLVIEWGATKMDAVQHALVNAPAVQSKMLGAVLNKVDFASLGRYQAYGYGYPYYYGPSGGSQPH